MSNSPCEKGGDLVLNTKTEKCLADIGGSPVTPISNKVPGPAYLKCCPKPNMVVNKKVSKANASPEPEDIDNCYTSEDGLTGVITKDIPKSAYKAPSLAVSHIGDTGFIIRDSWRMGGYPHPGGFSGPYHAYNYPEEGWKHVEPYKYYSNIIGYDTTLCSGQTQAAPKDKIWNQLGEPAGHMDMGYSGWNSVKRYYMGSFGCAVAAYFNCFNALGIQVGGTFPTLAEYLNHWKYYWREIFDKDSHCFSSWSGAFDTFKTCKFNADCSAKTWDGKPFLSHKVTHDPAAFWGQYSPLPQSAELKKNFEESKAWVTAKKGRFLLILLREPNMIKGGTHYVCVAPGETKKPPNTCEKYHNENKGACDVWKSPAILKSIKCSGDECKSKCCETCKEYKKSNPTKCKAWKADTQLATIMCVDKNCPSKCCGKIPTCADFKKGNPSACTDWKDPAFLKSTPCQGNQCKELCCRSCKDLKVSQYHLCPKWKPNSLLQQIKCTGSNCPKLCCDDLNCLEYKSAHPTHCDLWKSDSVLQTIKCTGSNCPQLCCRKETCKTWHKDHPSGCGLFAHYSGPDSLNCHKNTCQSLCCKSVCADFKRDFHVKNALCLPGFEWDSTKEQKECSPINDCRKRCCKRNLCRDWHKTHHCSNPGERDSSKDFETCTGSECDSKCCHHNCGIWHSKNKCPSGWIFDQTKAKKDCYPNCPQYCCYEKTCWDWKSNENGHCPDPMAFYEPFKLQQTKCANDCQSKCCFSNCGRWAASNKKCPPTFKFVGPNTKLCGFGNYPPCEEACCEQNHCNEWYSAGGKCAKGFEFKSIFGGVACTNDADCKTKCCAAIPKPTCKDWKGFCGRFSERDHTKDATLCDPLTEDCQAKCCRSDCGFWHGKGGKCLTGLKFDSQKQSTPCNPLTNCGTICCHHVEIKRCATWKKGGGQCPSKFKFAAHKAQLPCDDNNDCINKCCMPPEKHFCDDWRLEGKKCVAPQVFDQDKMWQQCAEDKDCQSMCCTMNCGSWKYNGGKCEKSHKFLPLRELTKCSNEADCKAKCCVVKPVRKDCSTWSLKGKCDSPSVFDASRARFPCEGDACKKVCCQLRCSIWETNGGKCPDKKEILPENGNLACADNSECQKRCCGGTEHRCRDWRSHGGKCEKSHEFNTRALNTACEGDACKELCCEMKCKHWHRHGGKCEPLAYQPGKRNKDCSDDNDCKTKCCAPSTQTCKDWLFMNGECPIPLQPLESGFGEPCHSEEHCQSVCCGTKKCPSTCPCADKPKPCDCALDCQEPEIVPHH